MLTLAFALWLDAGRAHDLGRHFERAKFKLGPKTLDLWVANDENRRARGLMYVEKLGRDEGMLFVFDRPQAMSFWMKNTLIPLAIGFFDETCRLREIVEMEVASSVLSTEVPTYHAKTEAKFALEMNSRWFDGKVKPGARLVESPDPRGKSRTLICK